MHLLNSACCLFATKLAGLLTATLAQAVLSSLNSGVMPGLIKVQGCLFRSNKGESGAAFQVADHIASDMVFNSSMFEHNQGGSNWAGAILTTNGNIAVRNCSFTNNTVRPQCFVVRCIKAIVAEIYAL